MMRRTTLLIALFALGLAAVGLAVAASNGHWQTHATGSAEVPLSIDTNAQGQANFQLAKDGQSISYRLNASNIEDAFMAHIHAAPPGVNGPIVVWLFPSTDPTQAPNPAAAVDKIRAAGSITAAQLTGAAGIDTLAELIALLEGGGAYVNVHTIANPPGEIRGDIG
jgi:hypothetical protein